MEKDQNEGVSKDETLNAIIPNIENVQKGNEPVMGHYRGVFKNTLSEIYDNIDKQKATLVNLPPFIKDKLKNKEILDAWQADMPPRNRPRP